MKIIILMTFSLSFARLSWYNLVVRGGDAIDRAVLAAAVSKIRLSSCSRKLSGSVIACDCVQNGVAMLYTAAAASKALFSFC